MKTLIFDFDGTLGDTSQLITTTLQQTIAHVGLPVPPDDQCRETIGLPLEVAFRFLTNREDKFAKNCAKLYRHQFFTVNAKKFVVHPYPHVVSTINKLFSSGFQLCIASSRNRDSLHQLLEEMKIDHKFQYTLGGSDVTHQKPAPDLVLELLRLTDTASEEALVIGDTAYDMAMGHAAYCMTCGVTYGNGSRESLETANADYMIDSFDQLLPLIERLSSNNF